MLFYSQCENGLIGFEFEDRSILSLEYYQYFCGGPQLGAPGYLQQRQRASDEKSTHSLNKDAPFHRPAPVVRYTYTTTVMITVWVSGTKRLLFPFHFSLVCLSLGVEGALVVVRHGRVEVLLDVLSQRHLLPVVKLNMLDYILMVLMVKLCVLI